MGDVRLCLEKKVELEWSRVRMGDESEEDNSRDDVHSK